MKITNREKSLLYILIYVVIFILGLNLILSPMWKRYQDKVLKFEEYQSLNIVLKEQKLNLPSQENHLEEMKKQNEILNKDIMDYKSNEDIEQLILDYSTDLKIIEFAVKDDEEISLMQDLLPQTTMRITVKHTEITLSGNKVNLPELINNLNKLNGCEIERIETQKEEIELELTFLMRVDKQ